MRPPDPDGETSEAAMGAGAALRGTWVADASGAEDGGKVGAVAGAAGGEGVAREALSRELIFADYGSL